ARKGEYIFRGGKAEVLSDDQNRIEVPEEKIKDFKFVNRDGEGENIELKDWSYWKGEINQGIPVFYRENEIKGQKGIIDFGLPFMYKQPAKYRVKDLLTNYSDKKDLAEAILGNAKKDSSLKGRIFFGNAKCLDKKPKVLDKVVV